MQSIDVHLVQRIPGTVYSPSKTVMTSPGGVFDAAILVGEDYP